jgi:gliding motility-associated-like protein
MAQVRFTENKGQWPSHIKFKSDLSGAKLFFTEGAMTYLFYDGEQIEHAQHLQDFKTPLNLHGIRIDFVGYNANAVYAGQNAYADYANYFIGNNPSTWQGHVQHFRKVFVTDIYPNIDFEIFENNGSIKYNFIVKPGGNASLIKLKYTGADSLYIKNGNLEIVNSINKVTELKPLVYQGTEENNTVISSSYFLKDNILSFNLSSKFNTKKNLIIDPALVFSTFSGSFADNFGYTATYDDFGHAYSGGTVFDVGFPTTTGAFQMAFAGGEIEDIDIGYIDRDCGILKYAKDGKSLLYATYLGGSLSNDQPHSMIVNSKGDLVVMGSTKSPDFPIGNKPTFDNSHNGNADIFIAVLSEDGSSLLNATYVGGVGQDGLNGDRASSSTTPLLYNYADDFRGEVILDSFDNIYVASSTNSGNFPTINAFDGSYNGGQEGCVFKLKPDCSVMLFSSYAGGIKDEAAYGLDLGIENDLYVTGGTTSSSFNYGVSGSSANNFGGRADGFLIRMHKNTGDLLAATMLGTAAYDQSYFVKTDKYGKPFVYGQSEGNSVVSANVYSNAGSKQFIAKFNRTLSAIELQTIFGASGKSMPDISPTAFLVDECERIFISGWGGFSLGGFSGAGTLKMPLTSNAIQKTTDGQDFYLAVFSKNLRELLFATYFGGIGTINTSSAEHVDGGTSRFDKKGIIYQSVCGGCKRQSLFPTTPGAWSRTNNSDNCNNALFKIDFENLNRKPVAMDSLYAITVTDTLDFDVVVSDPDFDDSLIVRLSGTPFTDPKFPKPLPTIQSFSKDPNSNKLTAKIHWEAGCQHASLDTIKLYVHVYDRGCPTQDSNKALIKIVVKDIPLTLTPESFCLNFKEDGSLKLTWKAFTKNKYFKHVILYRRSPNGTDKALDTIKNSDAGVFLDKVALDPKANNYTYYMVGVNICDKRYDQGVTISTLKEFNIPIDSTYLNYATVIDNSKVKISWFTSKEEDFGSYDVFKTENRNDISLGYRKIHTTSSLNDTNFVDEDVIVSDKSYCYKIGVNDKCGHVSKPSNEACNIVLKGDVGHLYFDLDWNPYRYWIGGVNSYELVRKVDTGTLRFLTNTGLNRNYRDPNLDLWWGAYFYQVRAFEGTNANGEGYNAISESNTIRLIQPPMVFVPNAFSPNDDANNDVWGVSHAFVRVYDLKVFNRWGQKVWENDFKGTQWDGKVNGAIAGNDVYVWIITYKGWDNKFYTQKGTVTVMQ